MLAKPYISDFPGILHIHLNTPKHQLRLESSIEISEDISRLLSGLNNEIFWGKSPFRVYALPHEPGSFLKRYKLHYVAGAASAIIFALETDMGKGFIRGLTGQEPGHWTEQIGLSLRNLGGDESTSDAEDETREPYIAMCDLIAQMAAGILQAPPSKLREIGITEEEMPQIYSSRNDFYESCLNDRDILGVGFSEKREFPVPRADFALQIVNIPEKSKAERVEWKWGTIPVSVTSPNWDQKDQQRFWKGRSPFTRTIYFSIEDGNFWKLIQARSLSADVIDEMTIQCLFKYEDGKLRETQAVKVLTFNGVNVSEPLPEEEIEALAANMTSAQELSEQDDLFSYSRLST